ncbi:hypothetical protein [Caulobacter segnis]|uniref:Uncharacterized protein n=1 Tax=Caulobacter segnis TaxID=88688 RepID=A0A2W5V6D2_9CAUL|nr:hypothetical protein [Caulobacter segnis]PZR32276.1 MAG: hypothetical protein DI526_17020 [Caulobacter segnis]
MSDKSVVVPEVSWKFRRIYTYAVLLISHGLLFFLVHRLIEARPLLIIAILLIAENVAMGLVYLAGATVTDLRKLTVAVRGDQPKGTMS